jgi:hypothetical protein
MLPLIKAITPLLYAIAIAFLVARRRVVRAFEKRGAFTPSTAMAPPSVWPLGRWWIGRLRGAGVLHATAAGTYWIDSERLASYHAERRKRAAVIALGLMAAAFAVLLLVRR